MSYSLEQGYLQPFVAGPQCMIWDWPKATGMVYKFEEEQKLGKQELQDTQKGQYYGWIISFLAKAKSNFSAWQLKIFFKIYCSFVTLRKDGCRSKRLAGLQVAFGQDFGDTWSNAYSLKTSSNFNVWQSVLGFKKKYCSCLGGNANGLGEAQVAHKSFFGYPCCSIYQ